MAGGPMGALFRALFALLRRTKRPPRPLPPPTDPPILDVVFDDPPWVAPTPPTTDPLAWRADWLTFRHQGRVYYLADHEPPTTAVLAAYRAHGYTDVPLHVCIGDHDYTDDPEGFVTACQPFLAAGLRVIPIVGYEGKRDRWQAHRADFPATLRRFVQVVDPAVSCYLLGVEVEEYWTQDETLDWIETIGQVSTRPQGVHFGATVWGPQSDVPGWTHGSQKGWWSKARLRAPATRLACVFQYRNYSEPAAVRANRAFLAPRWDVTGPDSHTAALTAPARLPSVHVALIAGEYAYNGTDPAASIVTEAEAQDLGRAALAAGAVGAMNGC